MDLVLNNLQWLVCHKSKRNQMRSSCSANDIFRNYHDKEIFFRLELTIKNAV